MNDTKRCSGYKGYHVCADDYPDHMVPIEKFRICKRDGRQPRCLRCDDYRWHQRPKHPVTGEVKKNWKHRIAESSGGTQKTPEWQLFLDRAEVQWNEEIKGHLLNTAPRDKKPKFNQGLPAAKPARKRTNLEPLDKLPPEGWVYIIAASRHASIMKIGSTFEYGIRDRLSEAKRWALAGSAVLLHKEWFSRCKQAESLVHKRLDYYRIVSPDAGDELFRTSFEHALANVMIIKNEVENDRKEQAMG